MIEVFYFKRVMCLRDLKPKFAEVLITAAEFLSPSVSSRCILNNKECRPGLKLYMQTSFSGS
jgi:hypothetical protein